MTALKLLDELPETPERDRRELALQILLGSAAAAVKGIGAPERERSLLRARDLSQRLGEQSHVFPVLWQLFHFHAQRGELQTAREYAEHALAVAESQCDAVMLAGARTALGLCLFYIGDFAGCSRQFELALAQDTPLQKRWYLDGRGFDTLAGALSALAEGILGYPDRCCVGVGEVVKRARTQSSLPDLAFALLACGRGHLLAGSPRSAQSFAEEAITLSETHGYVERAALGKCVRGVALTRQGELKQGIACILQGLSDYSATGGRLGQSEFYSALAAAFGKAGRTQEGLEAVDLGLAMGRDGGESFYRGELYRIRGELIQIEDPAHPHEAERLFRTAIDTASRRQARSFELRATTSLARLLAKQGKRDKARTMLAEIYNWFTEGFDTPDLKDAKDLLDELDA
jgi:tetratricopeptide (TPR) repeat protein